jgi:hypothetical protein
MNAMLIFSVQERKENEINNSIKNEQNKTNNSIKMNKTLE